MLDLIIITLGNHIWWLLNWFVQKGVWDVLYALNK